MALFDVISEDIKKAMIAKDKVALEALRGVKKEFLEAKTAKGASGELADDAALKILQKMVKQRKESAQNELAEAAVIEKYLPAKLSDAELEAEIKAIIAEVGAKSAQEMGKVMGVATKKLAGKADGKEISAKVKALLS